MDALLILTGKGIGIGLVAKSFIKGPSTTTYETILNIGLGQLVYNSELEGATLAIEYANSIATRGQDFQIYSDN